MVARVRTVATAARTMDGGARGLDARRGRHSVGGGEACGLLDGMAMGLSTSTLEMQIPEQHRERLHLLVQATRTVLVLSGSGDERFAGQPMVLLRADDDTTMYVAASLDRGQVAALGRDPNVTVVVQGTGYAVFEAEAKVLREGERELLERLTRDDVAVLGREKTDPSLAVLVVSPIEGAYWEGARRNAYQYRFPIGRREAEDAIELRGRISAASLAERF